MNIKSLIILVLCASIIKIIAIYTTNFDFFGDEAQYWLWSQKLDLGYYSKPPLLAWVIGFVSLLIGDSFAALKFIPLIFYILSSFIIYLLYAELFKNKISALICAMSFILIPSVSVSSFIISTDVILILFWSLSILYVLKIKYSPKLSNFVLLGVFLGLSFLSKYAAIYFFISLIFLIIFDKETKKVFIKNIFFSLISIVSCIIVILPNIIWNIQNKWITFSHTSENASLSSMNINFIQGIEFFLIQGLMISPILFFLFFLTIKKIRKNFETIFLLSFSLPIFSIVIIESIIVRANANWAAVALIPFFILIFKHCYEQSKKFITINNMFNFTICCILFFLISTSSSFKIFDRVSGITSFSHKLNDNIMLEKKYLVIQDRLLYSNLKYIFRNTEKVLLTPHTPKSKFTNHFQMSNPLLNNFEKDFYYIGNPSELNYLIKDNQIKKIKTFNVLFVKQPLDIYEVLF